MTSLRAQFTRELTIRGRAARTIQAYLACVASLAKHYQRSPDRISDEQIREWLAHLRTARKLSGDQSNGSRDQSKGPIEGVRLKQL